MSTEVKVPVLPESVADATVAAWHKQVGETIQRDENLVDLETDKVVLEVPSPVAGVIKKILRDSGEIVTSGELLGIIEPGNVEEPAQPVTEATTTPIPGNSETTRLSPASRRVVEEAQLDISQLEGSGRGGRITKGDVLNHLSQGGHLSQGSPAGPRLEERVKMSRLRSRVAERMKQAQNTAAILTSFNEVDLQAIMTLRAKYKQAFLQEHGVKLGLMSFFVTAVCAALAKHPIVNASLDGNEIVYHGYQDIGIAVSTERGLLVPILKNAEHLTLAEIETGIHEFASQARAGSIALEDLQGGTFTITNGGTFGSLLSTPLLNPPQSAILGMHSIKQRAVVVESEIVARPMMYIALSYDHRIIDGKDAVLFLVAVKDALEDPARLLLKL